VPRSGKNRRRAEVAVVIAADGQKKGLVDFEPGETKECGGYVGGNVSARGRRLDLAIKHIVVAAIIRDFAPRCTRALPDERANGSRSRKTALCQFGKTHPGFPAKAALDESG